MREACSNECPTRFGCLVWFGICENRWENAGERPPIVSNARKAFADGVQLSALPTNSPAFFHTREASRSAVSEAQNPPFVRTETAHFAYTG